MLVPDEIRKCVVFVGYHGECGMRWVGTAFFVGMPVPGHDMNFPYLVTAKHVIDGIKRKGKDGKVYLRINLKDGDCDYEPTDPDLWISLNEDYSTDVAVRQCLPKTQVDFLMLPLSMVVPSEVQGNIDFGVGDEVFITGMFFNHRGQKRNIPIVRVGNIAAMREELVQTRLGPMDAYLIEARSIGGISGSPVFVRPHPKVQPNTILMWVPKAPIYLLGMIHGHYDLPVETDDMIVKDEFDQGKLNMGS